MTTETTTPRAAAEAHAATCRAAMACGQSRPIYSGPLLARANLAGATVTTDMVTALLAALRVLVVN